MGGKGSGRYRRDSQRLPKGWHPRWLDKLDGRSPIAVAVKTHLQELHDHLGGDVSAIEARLMHRHAHLDLLLQQHEARSLSCDPGFVEADYLTVMDRYLRLSQALGLRRRSKDVTTLADLLEGRAGPPETPQDMRQPQGEDKVVLTARTSP